MRLLSVRAGPRGRQAALLAVGALAVLGGVLAAIDLAVDEPLRRHMERQLNERLDGYRVQVGRADFHVLGGGLDLEDLCCGPTRTSTS